MAEAVSRGADMVEFDLRRTADGVIVLMHDPVLKSEKGEEYPVSHTDYDMLCSVARKRGFELAAFEEILIGFGSRIAFDIEIKAAGFEQDILRLLSEYPPAHRPVLSSFKSGVIRKIRRLDSEISTGLVIGNDRFGFLNLAERPLVKQIISGIGVQSIHLHRTIASDNVVERLKLMGVSVFVWTVDDPDEIRRFIRMDVQGIITNKPDLLFDIRREMDAALSPIAGISPTVGESLDTAV